MNELNKEILHLGDNVFVVEHIRAIRLMVGVKQLSIYTGSRQSFHVKEPFCSFEQFVEIFHKYFDNRAFFVDDLEYCYIISFKHIFKANISKKVLHIDHRYLQDFTLPPETSLEPWLNFLKPDKTLQNMVEAMWDAPGMPGANQILNEFSGALRASEENK